MKDTINKDHRVKHGDWKKRIYRTWRGLKQRCNNPKATKYHNYGGRGIRVCPAWENDYIAFREWAYLNGYSDDLYIDRRDNDQNYSPENCRWITMSENNRNTRLLYHHNTTGYRGVSSNRSRTDRESYRARIQVDKKGIVIGSFPSKKEAAIAYDNYVIENELSHTRNFV